MTMVSIVVPLYNKANFVERALRSVFAQSHQDFEVIVVDDGSTDDGADKVLVLDCTRVKLVRQRNAGVSAARNKGVELASSELIAFLDADDEWDPWFLETVLGLATDFPEAGIYGTAYRYLMADGSTIVPEFPGVTMGLMGSFFKTPYLWTSAVAARKAVLVEVGGFPVGVRFGEDLDTWIRIALHYPVAWSPTVCAIYHNAASDVNHAGTLWVGDAPFAETVQKAKESIIADKWTDLYELLCSQRLRTFFVGTYMSGNVRLARKMVWESIRTRRERKRLVPALLVTALPLYLGHLVMALTTGIVDRDLREVTREKVRT